MKTFGLIGKSLKHSFSPNYFKNKFEKEKISDAEYLLYPLEKIEDFESLISGSTLNGLNVTIPYKESVIPYLTELDPLAEEIGAVNCIKFLRKNGVLLSKGYNTDVYGLETSLLKFTHNQLYPTLILGSGGASKAAVYLLKKFNIEYRIVSRAPNGKNQISYDEIDAQLLEKFKIIINSTPLGMYPNVADCAPIPFEYINENHFVFDMIYNPEETLLMKNSKLKGAKVSNGLEMLQLQAEKSWEIWNSSLE